MEPPKKVHVLYGVTLMEPPRPSSSSNTSYRGSDMPPNLDLFDMIHNAHGDTPQYATHERVLSPSIAPTTTTTASRLKHRYRVLGTLGLTGIVYFSSCGGPVGSELLISTGGPLVGLLSIGVYVLFCQLPLSLMATELSCAFPENGGHAVWAMTAFGPFWGFQSGYWSWIGSVFNNAIYPGLIFSAITEAYGIEVSSSVATFFIKVAIAVLLALPSYFSVRSVGLGSLALLGFVSITVLMLCVWSFVEGEGSWYRLGEVRTASDVTEDVPEGGIDWTLLVHTLFWSFDGMYSIAVIGGEVVNPARTYPRVMFLAVLLAVLTYLLVWISMIVADKTPWLELTEDALTDAAEAIGGSVLHQFVLITSILGSVGLYTCSFFFQTFLVQGMAQSQMLPALLRKRHARFKTPKYAFYVSLISTLALVGFEFEDMLNMTNACSGAFQILMVLSMLELRRSFPYLPRPMKMPGNMAVVAAALVPIFAVYVFLIVTTLREWNLAVLFVAVAIPGIVFPFLRSKLAGHSICS